MLLYRPKQKISTTESEEVKFPASSIDGLASVATSGSYNDLTDKPTVPGVPDVVQTTGTSTTSVMSQKATTDAVNSRLSKTDNTDIEVLGTKKATTTLGGNQLYSPNGMIFGGTAAAAGLVTRGICGVSTPSAGGACSKDNVYVNYDGNNDFNANRQIVLNAGTPGSHLGSNMYQYAVPRGDVVKNWVEAKDYVTSVKVNGNTVASSGGVVDIGTVVTDVSGKQDKITSSNKLAASLVSGLSTVATSGSYNDLSNKPTDYVTTADKAQTVNGVKTFVQDIVRKSSNIDISTDPTNTQYAYIDFWDKNDKRIAVIGSHHAEGKYSGAYLQAKNVSSMGIMADDKDNVKTFAPTPPDTDSSTQLATTEWVRKNNQAIRGFDALNYYMVDGVKINYPADNYFLIAYSNFCVNWAPVFAEIDMLDWDTRAAAYKVKVTGLLESATNDNVTTYTNKGNIGVTDSFGQRLNSGISDINNELFLVCRTTNKGRVRYEIWYNQRYSYNRHTYHFNVDKAPARTSECIPWNKLNVPSATDNEYAKKGVTVYMDSKKVNPTYIPTSSWGEDVFKTAVSDDESYTNVTIFNNNLYSITHVGVSTILNTTPYIDAKIKGYSGYKTIPTVQKRAEYRILTEDKGYLGGIRYDRYTDGDSATRMVAGSTLSGANNAVMLSASKGTASTKNTDSNIWAFVPLTDGNISLGGSGNRWGNAYIKNIVADSVTADNLPFTSDGLSTGTLGSTGLSVGRDYYIEKTVGECLISCVIRTYMEAGAKPTLNLPRIYTTVVPIQYGGTIYFLVVKGLGDVGGNTVPVTFSLKNTSGGTVTNTTVTSGTFKYKRI